MSLSITTFHSRFGQNAVDPILVNLAQACRRLAELGGQVIQQFQGEIGVTVKAPRDFVTLVDQQVQNEIVKQIEEHFPNSRVLGEEQDDPDSVLRFARAADLDLRHLFHSLGQLPTSMQADAETIWIIDPIDGTTNFIHGFPYYAVSIAVAIDGFVVAGAVLDVCRSECFWTHVGGPAMMNDQAIATADCRSLAASMLVGSVPRDFEKYPHADQIFSHVSGRCQSVRRLGSAALNLAYIAAGRLDGYWALSLQAWDIAAGVLLVHQAGGIQRLKHDKFAAAIQLISAASEPLCQQLCQIVDKAEASGR